MPRATCWTTSRPRPCPAARRWPGVATSSDVPVTLSTSAPLRGAGGLGDVTATNRPTPPGRPTSTIRPRTHNWPRPASTTPFPANGAGTQSNGANEVDGQLRPDAVRLQRLGRRRVDGVAAGDDHLQPTGRQRRRPEHLVGTNDGSPANSFAAWLATDPTGTEGPSWSNMVEDSASVYDADGDVTQTTDYVYATAASQWYGTTPTERVTDDWYDWRDRLVVTKSGAKHRQGGRRWSGRRPITCSTTWATSLHVRL